MAGDKCDVCGGIAIGVAASTCGPVSFAYCRKCVGAGAEPYGALVAYLSMAVNRGEELRPEAALIHSGYYPIIDVSLKEAGKTREELYADVDAAIAEYIEYFSEEEASE